jgi:2-deoxy-D-gluconate 3-dehydrogenase
MFLKGSVEILVNAAGIQRRHSSEIFPDLEWDEIISVNLTSVFLYSKKVSQDMISHGYGKIINVSSIMSQFGGINIPAYTASKGGVAQLTKAMSNDLAAKGIRINAISPGYINTNMNKALLQDSDRTAKILNRTPIGRWGTPSDLKGISVFLASSASDFLTGTIIPVDGGYSGM